MGVSVVIPVKDERRNVARLHEMLVEVLDKPFEIIFVDDGSRDGTYTELLKLSPVKVIRFRRNFGQSAAMDAGFHAVKYDTVVSMDGDLQNDPRDIPKMVKLLSKYDAVSGWRKNRHDSVFKHLASRVAYHLRRVFLGTNLHDYGCSLKAYRRDCLKDLQLMGEMHRYIPALLEWKGYRIGEMIVRHHHRRYGRTKYGLTRLFKGFIDMLSIIFWKKFSNRPLHIFGGAGILLGVVGFILGTVLLVWNAIADIDLSGTPLPLLAVLLVILGVQFFVSGLMADISIKNYYKNGAKTYSIAKVTVK